MKILTPIPQNDPYSSQAYRASIVIPAYNEEKVIRRCLDALMSGSMDREFDVIVVCNGCTDATAEIAMQSGYAIRVCSINEASKTAALNFGDEVAYTYPRVYLDADLEIDADSIRALLEKLSTETPAAIGFMDMDYGECSLPVRLFYSAWMEHGYVKNGKFGGVYALSKDGVDQRGRYPDVIADDGFAKSSFRVDQVESSALCRFSVYPPRNLADLVRIRARVFLGNKQLERVLKGGGRSTQSDSSWLTSLVVKPSKWVGLLMFFAVNLTSKWIAWRMDRRSRYTWLRDESSRQTSGGEA